MCVLWTCDNEPDDRDPLLTRSEGGLDPRRISERRGHLKQGLRRAEEAALAGKPWGLELVRLYQESLSQLDRSLVLVAGEEGS